VYFIGKYFLLVVSLSLIKLIKAKGD